MNKFLCILSLVLLTNMAFGSCYGTKYALTEILANQEDNHHIFTCEIIATYSGPGGYNSIAIVKDIFRGSPSDSVYIVTGGNTTAGGSKIAPGTEWVIISETKDDKHYTATICFNLSRRIDEKDIECSNRNNNEGQKFLNIIKQYFHLESEKFTGKTNLEVKGDVFAQASFKDGKADGNWKHIRYSSALEKRTVISEIEYKSGQVEGNVLRYHPNIEPRMLYYESYIKNGLIQWEIWNQKDRNTYTYQADTLKIMQTVILNESLDTVRQSTTKYLDYINEGSLALRYNDGYYFNLKDSSVYQPLCEGFYHMGAKVGLWKYFNKSGDIVRTQEYSHPDISMSKVMIYDEEGMVKLEGNLVRGHRVGLWKYFYKGKLENEYYYNTNSEIKYQIRYYSSGGKLFSPYDKGEVNGSQIKFNPSGQSLSICDYKAGIKDGRFLKFDDEGKVIGESIFRSGRETTIFTTSTNAAKIDGFSNGYNVQYSLRDGHKMYEGEIWMGYSIGKHIRYSKNGDYAITYYESDKKKLINLCINEIVYKTEYYNKEGELIIVEN